MNHRLYLGNISVSTSAPIATKIEKMFITVVLD